jgi:hypothetical protein
VAILMASFERDTVWTAVHEPAQPDEAGHAPAVGEYLRQGGDEEQPAGGVPGWGLRFLGALTALVALWFAMAFLGGIPTGPVEWLTLAMLGAFAYSVGVMVPLLLTALARRTGRP